MQTLEEHDKQIRAKAIDEFVKSLYKIGEHREFDWEDIYKLSEQMKGRRLIDADAFIEYVNRRYDLCSDELRMMIENQPTAYNVEKVVAEIEKQGYEVEIDDGSLFTRSHTVIDTYVAIAKVRKGGVDG